VAAGLPWPLPVLIFLNDRKKMAEGQSQFLSVADGLRLPLIVFKIPLLREASI
jgi:hypothetical protein